MDNSWIINETFDESVTFDLYASFTIAGIGKCYRLKKPMTNSFFIEAYPEIKPAGTSEYVYMSGKNGFTKDQYRAITFHTDEYKNNIVFYNWLQANGRKVITTESVKNKLKRVIGSINEVTGQNNTDLAPAVKHLIEDFEEVESLEVLEGYFDGTLTEVDLPNITSIRPYAFYEPVRSFDDNKRLKSINMPKVTTIGQNAFYSCSMLDLDSLPSGLTSIGDYAFQNCSSLKLDTLPSGLTSIGSYAFQSVGGLTITSIPSGVTNIAARAFSGCTGLTSITFLGTPTAIDSTAFNGCTNLTEIYVPWAKGEVSGAPWSATNATIYYSYPQNYWVFNEVLSSITTSEIVVNAEFNMLGYGVCDCMELVKTSTAPSVSARLKGGSLNTVYSRTEGWLNEDYRTIMFVDDSYKNNAEFLSWLLANATPSEHITYRYVSLGDSIAAGHTIDDKWAANYGEGSQYGVNGNTETAIVPNSYTDRLAEKLKERYGSGIVSVKSFARSGDTVADLMEKLNHSAVIEAIEKANLVTICIGANDILEPAMSKLEEYLNYGDLSGIEAIVNNNLNVLNTDSEPNSYVALINRLNAINPKATYVFTTIYNPYKYLYLERSTAAHDYKDGFLGPLMWAIPDSWGSTIANSIRSAIINSSAVSSFFDRVNGLGDWAETYINRLNQIIKDKADKYDNVLVADSKLVFESFPDRNLSANKHYNDLVSVEFTRGYVVEDCDWGQFWANVDYSVLLTNTESVANEIIDTIINDVIVPDVDPHPETFGHYALYSAFFDKAIAWVVGKYIISYNANDSTGSTVAQRVLKLSGYPAYAKLNANTFTHPTEGYQFVGWNTERDGTGTPYTEGQMVSINGNLNLYAQWSNMCTVTVKHSYDDRTNIATDSDTGNQECYALYINGVEQADLGAFSNPERTYILPYGTSIGVIVSNKLGGERSYITYNGETVNRHSENSDEPPGAKYSFTVTNDTVIEFEWNRWLDQNALFYPQTYWNCYITTK